MSIRLTGRVARARLVASPQLDLFADREALVRDALRPGRKTERYGRRWHVGQVRQDADSLYGRLGFDRMEGADIWQDEIEDFENQSRKSGAAAPFVIRLADLVVVYQPRKQAIRQTAFVQADAGLGEAVAIGRSDGMPDLLRRWNSAIGDEDVTTEVGVSETGEVDRATLLEELDKTALIR
ncbi:hypothetical protein [Catenuloplanes japonicus]|uniref:hypothetical protein n=1 Tax=Catenuloplanes japonicus TaxID=33876 RepID=UPI000524B167|nr:hypothetical protein [Catenuloplanes japonicus]